MTPDKIEFNVPLGEHVIRVRRSGTTDAPSVLFLHGTGPGATGWESFRPLMPHLAAFDNLVPDLVGFGDSSHPDAPPAGAGPWIDLRAESIIQLLDTLDVGPVDLVGHSYGGRLGIELLTRKPEVFRRVVLIASGGTPIKPTLNRLTSFYDNPTAENMRNFVESQLYPGRDIPAGLDSYFDARLATALRPEVRRSFEAAMGPGEPAPVYDDAILGSIHHDALVVHGQADQTIPVEASLYLAQHLPHADLHIFSRGGHLVQLEVTDQLGSLIGAFLRDTTL
ncbi:2-hydroxymuconate-semialdehyde hydrolase [Nocardia kruczakiae]|uniref:2-hydroxymuconate-semialdehyde hydrolase n=1 Tax=Nocardia kruczakiae TaxID=261477 RepID=A0ABU1XQS6_9NOCA|nr:alpha/beta hydrolase [Nocardia kruczakiae]MDR7172925.1 2-hydroxymuconate-semialdehyde hydrolase [Nocardia kruczakiae]